MFWTLGIWFTFPGEQTPSLTIIGSANFGYRSQERDSEAQVILMTTNKALKEQLGKELDVLFTYTEAINDAVFSRPNRSVPFWIRLMLRTRFRSLF